MKKGHFFEKRVPKIPPLYSIPFLSVLRQNIALNNFRKRWQRSIVERNIGLEYALSCEFYETFENTFFTKFLWVTTSVRLK